MIRSCLPVLRRHFLLASTCLVASGGFTVATAGVTGFSGQGGTISQPNPRTTIIHQTADKAIFNVASFDIGRGESITFQQPNAGSIALTRVQGGAASQIDGALTANGRVWIVNPFGVIFGVNAVVNVGGLLATTADIRDADFLGGAFKFGIASPQPNAAIVNRGAITASGGEVVLAGARVDNQGMIVAEAGTVVLAGGKTFAVDFAGDKLLRFAVTAPVTQAPLDESGAPAEALIGNSGTILADGGKVIMTARAAKGVVDNVINTTGIIEAKTASLVNGEIVLDGGTAGTVQVAGTLDASGKNAGETGGKVKILGETVSLAGTARVDVSGAAGGGVAEIGGKAHGAGPRHAETTLIAGGALVDADALTRGNGGTIVVWSEGFTSVAGTLTARGGARGGNGGFIETSSHGALGIASGASVLTSARFGQAGQWLLDPFDVNIGNAQVNVSGATGTIFPTASGATVDAAVLDAALNAGSNIKVQSTGTGPEAGNINCQRADYDDRSAGPGPHAEPGRHRQRLHQSADYDDERCARHCHLLGRHRLHRQHQYRRQSLGEPDHAHRQRLDRSAEQRGHQHAWRIAQRLVGRRRKPRRTESHRHGVVLHQYRKRRHLHQQRAGYSDQPGECRPRATEHRRRGGTARNQRHAHRHDRLQFHHRSARHRRLDRRIRPGDDIAGNGGGGN